MVNIPSNGSDGPGGGGGGGGGHGGGDGGEGGHRDHGDGGGHGGGGHDGGDGGGGGGGHDGGGGPTTVTISINNTQYSILPGSYPVSGIKQKGGVPAAEELEQVVAGVFTPLADVGTVTIRGGEIFISHVRASAAS